MIISRPVLLQCTTTLADSEGANTPRQLLKEEEGEEDNDNDNGDEATVKYSYSLFLLHSIIVDGDQIMKTMLMHKILHAKFMYLSYQSKKHISWGAWVA